MDGWMDGLTVHPFIYDVMRVYHT